MKKFYLLLVALNSYIVFGQFTPGTGSSNTASITADLPNITPASPTVAALMKFEEVPVDNYTGVPDISIPIYSVQTLSKDVSINVALKYHPASIALKEVASYTGLGWNLNASGVISRTVRGLPDEIYRQGNIAGAVKPQVGIYQTTVSPYPNRYYEVINNTASDQNKSEYLWGAFEKGIYDTEHDLYQYNFMGNTGRFYIKKNGSNLEVVKLDNDNSLQIEFSYIYSNSTYTFNSFTIYDDKGYKYIFSAKETTTETTSSVSSGWGFMGSTPSPSIAESISYTSSFHLTQIIDNNAQVLANFTYQNSTEVVSESNYMFANIEPVASEIEITNWINDGIQCYGLPPKEAHNNKSLTIVTKKLLQIDVINKAKIDFEIESGRQDSNINPDASKLKSITVKNYLNQQVKKFTLKYNYLSIVTQNTYDINLKRLALMAVEESNLQTSEVLSYQLGYKTDLPGVVYNLREDYWGYFRRGGFGKKTDPDYCTAHVLTSMMLPTKGIINFEFEPNTYSYIGNTALTEFDNSTSYTDDIFNFVILPGQTISNPLIVNPNTNHTISFEPEAPAGGYYFRMAIQSTGEVRALDSPGMTRLNDGTGTTEPFQFKTGETYTITMVRKDTVGQVTGSIILRRQTPSIPSTFKGIYGGGVRIKKIIYIDGFSVAPKEKYFSYNSFSDPDRSSGALVFAKPVFTYTTTKNIHYVAGGTKMSSPRNFVIQANYNNLLGIRTKGADVGYKYVTVWETGNGKSEYTYTSPLDHPETQYTITYPFKPSSNVDYKRGLLLREKHFRQNQTVYEPVAESWYDYNFGAMDEAVVSTGIRVFTPSSCPMAPNYATFQNFIICVNDSGNCSIGWGFACNPLSYLTYENMNTAYGWPKLVTKSTQESFYHLPGDPAKLVTTTETYEYNNLNKRISKSTTTSSLGDILTMEYAYDSNTGTNNRIGEIKSMQTKRNGDILDKKEIIYSNSLWGSLNTAFLPSTVSIQKGASVNNNEVRLRFIKYDVNSNPIEAQLENGIPIVYVWGYNNSLPVAVIENITLNDINAINSSLITNVQNASQQNASYSETTLLTKLTELRNALPANTMVRTFTYKPLVGVTTMTDPNGIVIKYSYDEFNRLEKTIDADNKILSENDYHYKP